MRNNDYFTAVRPVSLFLPPSSPSLFSLPLPLLPPSGHAPGMIPLEMMMSSLGFRVSRYDTLNPKPGMIPPEMMVSSLINILCESRRGRSELWVVEGRRGWILGYTLASLASVRRGCSSCTKQQNRVFSFVLCFCALWVDVQKAAP